MEPADVRPRWLGRADRTCGARATFAALFAVTLLVLLSIGATLPVLPQYVKGPIGSTDLAVGIVTGAYAITGLACRPIAGSIADDRGRRPVVVAGAIVTVVASLLYFVPFGVAGLLVARLILGAGEGVVYTASSAWVVDITDPARRGRIIGLYGLAIWGGLSFGPPIGDFLHRELGYEAVWAFAAAAPLARRRDRVAHPRAAPGAAPTAASAAEPACIAPEAVGPGPGDDAGDARLRGARRVHRPPPRRSRDRTRFDDLHRLRADRGRRPGPLRLASGPLRRRSAARSAPGCSRPSGSS